MHDHIPDRGARHCARAGCARAAFALSVMAASRPAAAQDTAAGFALDRFQPSGGGSDWFTLKSLDFCGTGRIGAGLVLDWAHKPSSTSTMTS